MHNTSVRRKYHHGWRIRSGAKALGKVRSFVGEGRAGRIFSYLRKLDTAVFEELVLEALRPCGYIDKRNGRYTGDGGIDGRIWHCDRGWGAIQCKRYSGPIATADLRKFVHDLRREGLQFGFFIHTGKTPSSVDRRGLRMAVPSVEIVSGQQLIDLIDGRWRAAA